jgi:DNA-binding NarL/FixJ family response regulator
MFDILSFLSLGGDKGPDLPCTAPGADMQEGAGKPPRVLIVEDEYLVAMEAEAALADAGFEVVGIAHSAEEAVALARTAKPHLVVMDIRLASTRDGVDAAREIFEATGIRCLFVTAHQTPDVRLRAQTASPLGWLPKPYTPDALVVAVQGALARQDIEG